MLVEMTVKLPYSWCQYCTRQELRIVKFHEEEGISVANHICANASICEAAEKAKLRERAESNDFSKAWWMR